jgi:predicted O-methyltransferase YrrM
VSDTWTAVDALFEETLLPADPALDEALEASAAAGLPPHAVSPTQGRLLHLFARMIGARRVLEIGTLGGYSAIWLARALPADGRLITLEISPAHAAVARENLARAGVTDKVEVRVGDAHEGLASLIAEGGAPFDLVFVDADKKSCPAYLRAARALVRKGSLVIVDNVVRHGAVLDESGADANVVGVRAALAALGGQGLTATAIQTVGRKGYDGFALALVDA